MLDTCLTRGNIVTKAGNWNRICCVGLLWKYKGLIMTRTTDLGVIDQLNRFWWVAYKHTTYFTYSCVESIGGEVTASFQPNQISITNKGKTNQTTFSFLFLSDVMHYVIYLFSFRWRQGIWTGLPVIGLVVSSNWVKNRNVG